MKLLTLNTHSWLEIHQLQKIATLVDFIIAEEVDLIALQEVNQNIIATCIDDPEGFISAGALPLREDNFALILMKLLNRLAPNYRWSWVDSHQGWGTYDEGIALITRLPVLRVKNIETSREEYTYNDVFRRCALAMELETGVGPAWCVSVHMNWWFMDGVHLFEHDFASLDQQIRELAATSPIFLLGDFNNDASVANEGYQQMCSLGWQDSFYHAQQVEGEYTVHKNISGWEDATRQMRLDYVFSSEPITFSQHRVIFPDNTDQAISDHSGLLVEFSTDQIKK